jgi:hypothetical protein
VNELSLQIAFENMSADTFCQKAIGIALCSESIVKKQLDPQASLSPLWYGFFRGGVDIVKHREIICYANTG